MKIYNTGLQHTNVPLTFSADNTVIDIIKVEIPNQSWYITYLNWRITGGNVGNTTDVAIYLQDNSTTFYQSVIAKGDVAGSNLSIVFPIPIKITMGNNLTIHFGASGNAGTKILANIGLFQK